jgi:hypothetical protein
MSTQTNIHWAKSVQYSRKQFSTFWTHEFIVTTSDGQTHEFSAFSKQPLDLVIGDDELALECQPGFVEPSEVASA